MITSSCPLASRSPVVMPSVVAGCNCAQVVPLLKNPHAVRGAEIHHQVRHAVAVQIARRQPRRGGAMDLDPGRAVQIAPHPVAREVHDEVVAAIAIEIGGHDRAHIERMQLRPRPVCRTTPTGRNPESRQSRPARRHRRDRRRPGARHRMGAAGTTPSWSPSYSHKPRPGKSNTPASTSPSPSKSTPTIAVGLAGSSWNQNSSPSASFVPEPHPTPGPKSTIRRVVAATREFAGSPPPYTGATGSRSFRDESRVRTVRRNRRPDWTAAGRSFESCCSGYRRRRGRLSHSPRSPRAC